MNNNEEIELSNLFNKPKKKRKSKPKDLNSKYILKRNPKRNVYFENSLIAGSSNGQKGSIEVNLDIRHKEEDNSKEEFACKEKSKKNSGFDFMSLLRENGNIEQDEIEEEIQESRIMTRRSRRNKIMRKQIIENISDDETHIIPNPESSEKIINESDMNHALLKSNEKANLIDDQVNEEYINENMEFKNEKDVIDFVFEKLKTRVQINENKYDKLTKIESDISQINENKKKVENDDISNLNRSSNIKETMSKIKQEVVENSQQKGVTEISKIINNNKIGKSNQIEEESTVDEPENSTQSRTLKTTPQNENSLKNHDYFKPLRNLLNHDQDKFKDSVLRYMILNSETKITNWQTKESIVKDMAKYDQYLMNDNLEFLGVVLTILYSEKDSSSLQDPLIQKILRLLIKRLLNTTDNYIQCEKSFSMILTKYTKNVRERFNDLKSYLLNEKLKNMSDLKFKTNSLVKKMNMTLDTVGGKNAQVASAVSKRHDQIEGFVGNYVERDEYSQLNLNKIMNTTRPLQIPQLNGKQWF